MNKVSDVLSTSSLYRTIEKRDSNFHSSIATIVPPHVTNGSVMTTEQANNLMDECSDLISDANYRPFFFKKLYAIGPTAFLQLADHTRKYGKYPARLFVKMLRQTGSV